MKSKAIPVLTVFLSLFILVQVFPPAAGSSLHIYVNPSNGVAYWNSETATYINITGGNFTNYTKAGTGGFSFGASVNTTTPIGLKDEEKINQTIAEFNDSIQVFHLDSSMNLTVTQTASGIGLVAITRLNMSLRWLPNGTAGAYNMTWKSFNFSGTLNSIGSNGDEINLNSPAGYFENITELSMLNGSVPYLKRVNILNFGKFSIPLANWARTYSATLKQTVYSYQASALNETVFRIPFISGNATGNYTMSLREDPSAVIVFEGSGYAIGNTIYAVSPPGQPFEEAAIATVIIAVSLFSVYAIASRRRRSGRRER